MVLNPSWGGRKAYHVTVTHPGGDHDARWCLTLRIGEVCSRFALLTLHVWSRCRALYQVFQFFLVSLWFAQDTTQGL